MLHYSLSTVVFLHVSNHRSLKATVQSPGSDVEKFQPEPPASTYKNIFLFNLYCFALEFLLIPLLNPSVPPETAMETHQVKKHRQLSCKEQYLSSTRCPHLAYWADWGKFHLVLYQAWLRGQQRNSTQEPMFSWLGVHLSWGSAFLVCGSLQGTLCNPHNLKRNSELQGAPGLFQMSVPTAAVLIFEGTNVPSEAERLT